MADSMRDCGNNDLHWLIGLALVFVLGAIVGIGCYLGTAAVIFR